MSRSVVDRSVTCKVEVTPIDLPSIVAHVNTTNAHPMRIQLDSVWMRIESASKRAPCERALSSSATESVSPQQFAPGSMLKRGRSGEILRGALMVQLRKFFTTSVLL